MNIMLLAMSTYPGTKKICYASYGESEKYSYYSQLEPGCKHFITALADDGQKFDKIISLCTIETLTAPRDEVDKDGNPAPKEKYIGDEDISDISPYDFFKKRIIGYIRNDETAFDYEKKLGIDVGGYTHFERPELYADLENLEDLFVYAKIDKDELEITSTIESVIDIINKLPKDGGKINLYLNAQGGSRKNVQIINTVLNMLQSREYTLKQVNVIEFNPDRSSNEYKILDVTRSYLMNDLAAAMNAFLQYGRADMFVNYYKRYKETRSVKNLPEDKVVDSINNISDAILICDTDGFLAGINKLEESITEYKKVPVEDKDNFFMLIEEDIKKSYEALFRRENIINDLDTLAEWCFNKNLIQQALTILESKTPEFVFNHGFLYAKPDDETKEALIKLKNDNTTEIPKYKFNTPKYLIVNTFCLLNCVKEKNRNGNLEWKANDDFLNDENAENATQKIIDGTYSFNYARNFKNKNVSSQNPVLINLYSDLFSNNKNDPEAINEAKKLFRNFVRLYRTICELRNSTNHSGGKNDILKIKNYIRELTGVLKQIKQKLPGTSYDFFNGNDLS